MRYAVVLFAMFSFVALVAGLFFIPVSLYAQEDQPALGVAVTQLVVPEAVSGDIVAFDPVQGLYRLAQASDQATGFGVIVSNPVLILHTEAADTPVVTSGLAEVNVVGTNGPIGSGDAIAVSSIHGKGERVRAESRSIIGFARESFIPASESAVGRINVELAPGAWVQPKSDEDIFSGTDVVAGTGTVRPLFGFVSRSFAAITRFLLAALFAAGALIIAYRLYTKNLVAGIASIGRNPLAQRSIKTMMAANIGLIILVTLVGLIVSALIIAL